MYKFYLKRKSLKGTSMPPIDILGHDGDDHDSQGGLPHPLRVWLLCPALRCLRAGAETEGFNAQSRQVRVDSGNRGWTLTQFLGLFDMNTYTHGFGATYDSFWHIYYFWQTVLFSFVSPFKWPWAVAKWLSLLYKTTRDVNFMFLYFFSVAAFARIKRA